MAEHNDLWIKVRQMVYDETGSDGDVFTLAIKKFLSLPEGDYENFLNDRFSYISETIQRLRIIDSTPGREDIGFMFFHEGNIYVTGETPEEIYSRVQKLQEKYNLKYAEGQVNKMTILWYNVDTIEVLTDNRDKLGHSKVKTERIISSSNRVFVSGEEILFTDLLQRRELKLLSKKEEEALQQFVYKETEKIDLSDDELKVIATRVAKLSYGGSSEFFYEKVEENDTFLLLK